MQQKKKYHKISILLNKLSLIPLARVDPNKQKFHNPCGFVTPQGLFEFRRMPFGLNGAPGNFHRPDPPLMWNVIMEVFVAFKWWAPIMGISLHILTRASIFFLPRSLTFYTLWQNLQNSSFSK